MLSRALRVGMVAVVAVLVPLTAALAEKRVALVVGNSAYRHVSQLANPDNDARLIADTLSSLGFTLIGGGVQLDLDKPSFDRVVQRFGERLLGADVGLFYYAGHGVQVEGANYLVPVDANPKRKTDVDFQMLDTRLVLRQMEGAGTRLNVVILDACRNNPFGGRGLRSANGGLAQMQAPEGTLISFATQPGNVAVDGNDGHSPFTRALAATIRRPGLDQFETFNDVGLAVKQATGGTQQPWLSSSPIAGKFYFAGAAASAADASAKPASPVKPDEVVALEARLKALEEQIKRRSEPKVAAVPPADKPAETARPLAPSIALETKARNFLADYMRHSEGALPDVVAYVRQTFAPEVDHFGERKSNKEVVEDQRRYAKRWPQRRYRVRPDTTRIDCDKARSACLVAGELDYEVSNPASGQRSTGVTTFEFRVRFTAAGPKIVFENGQVVSR